MPPLSTPLTEHEASELDAIAQSLLRNNDHNGYTVPSPNLYPFQWNWDAAVSAFGWFQFDVQRAFLEIDKLLSAQWHNGMVPHIVFHKKDESYFPGPEVWDTGAAIPSSGYSQPPILASILMRIQERTLPEDTPYIQSKLKAYFPKLMNWHRWFWEERNPTGKGLIAILHPWESGRDNSADWDAALRRVDITEVEKFRRKDLQHVDADARPHNREYQAYLSLVKLGKEAKWDSQQLLATQPFVMFDVFMTAILLKANRDLLLLAEQLAANTEAQIIRGWISQMEAHFEEFWNPDLDGYCAIDYRTGRHVEVLSSATFSVFYSGAGEQTHLTKMGDLFDRWCTGVKYMVPSLNPYDTRFEEKRYWRGPTWLVANYLLAEGFTLAQMPHRTDLIRTASTQLIKHSKFHEYYSAHTGAGLGGKDFSWTAALWLAWLSPTRKMMPTTASQPA